MPAFEEKVDPYALLRVLEDVTRDQASIVKALERILVKLRSDIDDEDLQQAALNYLRRLRILRNRLERALNGAIDFRDADQQIVYNVATLSEYMLIVGYELERKVLERAILLARRGARLLAPVADELRRDLEQVEKISERLQEIVDKYY